MFAADHCVDQQPASECRVTRSTMVNYELFDVAVSSGDLDAIERFLREPEFEPARIRINRWFRLRYVSNMAGDLVPIGEPHPNFLSRLRWCLRHALWKDAMRTGAWFFGVSATALIGDIIRGLLDDIYWKMTMPGQPAFELTEMVLSSHLYLSMSTEEQARVVSMMLMIIVRRALHSGVVRLLVAHGAVLTKPPKTLGYRTDIVTTKVLLDSGMCAISHRLLERASETQSLRLVSLCGEWDGSSTTRAR